MGNTNPTHRSLQRARALVVFGLVLTVLSSVGLILIRDIPGTTQPPPVVFHTPMPTLALPDITATSPRQAMISRGVVAPTFPPQTATPTPELTQTALPTIAWTDAEKNALSWLCWYEVRGMGDVVADACLSVISTVRARYAYNSGFGTNDVISTILAEGQFTGVEIDTSQPASSELYWLAEIYANGARGSCTGYFYFDSVPGGPSLCVIRSSNGQFIEFHNGWK
ncbi:MAG: hypothetical protein JXB30_10420 [Anaerolineae bacterium]|nr:hypothetical protein [Anaerolineae bacterium]